jgi:Mg-chelatase subunit ChlD
MSNAIIPGSLTAISQSTGKALAESFLSCDALILLDMSGSMESCDTPTGESRRKVATNHLIRLQKNNAGKLALICFADSVVFCPAGIPQNCGGSTHLDRGLSYIKPADDCDMKIIVISDGSPNDAEKALKIASGFKNKIDTIFVGPEDDREGGRAFLERLAAATGGIALKSDGPGLLGKEVETLLLRG